MGLYCDWLPYIHSKYCFNLQFPVQISFDKNIFFIIVFSPQTQSQQRMKVKTNMRPKKMVAMLRARLSIQVITVWLSVLYSCIIEGMAIKPFIYYNGVQFMQENQTNVLKMLNVIFFHFHEMQWWTNVQRLTTEYMDMRITLAQPGKKHANKTNASKIT